MITNRESIDLAAWAYTVPPDIVGPIAEHPIRIHFKKIDGITYVSPEGSKTEQDWLDDFRGWVDPFLPRVNHGDGFIPEGFYVSCKSVLNELAAKLWSAPFCLVGHSRGGAQAGVLASLLFDRGTVAKKVYLLEPARAFIFRTPAEFGAAIPVWGVWNGNDPVPHVPLGRQFDLQIVGRDAVNPFDNHHLPSVASALDATLGGEK
jgi:hypothetical protein